MRFNGISLIAAAGLAIYTPLMSAQDLSAAQADLTLVRSEIKDAQADDAHYTGGLVKTLSTARLAILRQTEAMLEQKVLALKSGTRVVYEVDGKAFSLPPSAPQMLAEVESAIEVSELKIRQQEAEVARYTGGLSRAMSLSTLETLRQTHAMLEQKKVSLQFALPQYVGFSDGASKSSPVGTSAAETSDATQINLNPTQSSPTNELRESLTFEVAQKGFIPADASSRRYQALLTLKCWYVNKSAKDIRAFTGTIIFQDLFEREIYRANVTISNPIKAGQQATWDGSIEHNQFIESQQRFRAAELRDLKVVWAPGSIIFSDGTKLGGN